MRGAARSQQTVRVRLPCAGIHADGKRQLRGIVHLTRRRAHGVVDLVERRAGMVAVIARAEEAGEVARRVVVRHEDHAVAERAERLEIVAVEVGVAVDGGHDGGVKRLALGVQHGGKLRHKGVEALLVRGAQTLEVDGHATVGIVAEVGVHALKLRHDLRDRRRAGGLVGEHRAERRVRHEDVELELHARLAQRGNHIGIAGGDVEA